MIFNQIDTKIIMDIPRALFLSHSIVEEQEILQCPRLHQSPVRMFGFLLDEIPTKGKETFYNLRGTAWSLENCEVNKKKKTCFFQLWKKRIWQNRKCFARHSGWARTLPRGNSRARLLVLKRRCHSVWEQFNWEPEEILRGSGAMAENVMRNSDEINQKDKNTF